MVGIEIFVLVSEIVKGKEVTLVLCLAVTSPKQKGAVARELGQTRGLADFEHPRSRPQNYR
jgi:hypothetical protein